MDILLRNCGLCFSGLVLAFAPICGNPQTVTTTKPYVPKFARVQTDAVMLDIEFCMRPEYPQSSVRNQEQGRTTLVVKVAKNGVDLAASIIESSGYPDLDQTTIAAVAGCKFRPATIDGKPVQGRTYVVYEWKIE